MKQSPPLHNNRAVIAAAGSLKTQYIVDEALAAPSKRVLVTTYTNENLRILSSRLARRSGVIPGHITLMTWFTFLLNECARPYQTSLLNEPNVIRGLNFLGSRHMLTRRANVRPFFLDSRNDIYRDGASQFSCEADSATEGLVTKRLSEMFDHIYVDEMQDLVGYDLDFLDLLMKSPIAVTVVGDPRQHTYSTNTSNRNKKYRGVGLRLWFEERRRRCQLDERQESFRCNQEICNFADGLYPKLMPTISRNEGRTGHDGIFFVRRCDALAYAQKYEPKVLRYDKNVDTLGLAATNIGLAKGGTFSRVMIFPTRPMLKYFASMDADAIGSKDKFYVAVTRARHSAAFVVPDETSLSCYRLA